MGPAERDNDAIRQLLAGGGGFEPPLRGPEPRVLPLDDPPATPQPYHTPNASADRRFERAARAEARDLGCRNLDRFAGARIASVPGGATGDDECAKSGDRDAAAAAQRLDDAADEGVHGALRGGLRAPRILGHDRHQLGLGHRAPRPSLARQGDGVNQVVTRRTASRKNAGWKGFSTTSTPASRRNLNASRFAVSPVMKMKRWLSDGSPCVASRKNSSPSPSGMRMSDTMRS